MRTSSTHFTRCQTENKARWAVGWLKQSVGQCLGSTIDHGWHFKMISKSVHSSTTDTRRVQTVCGWQGQSQAVFGWSIVEWNRLAYQGKVMSSDQTSWRKPCAAKIHHQTTVSVSMDRCHHVVMLFRCMASRLTNLFSAPVLYIHVLVEIFGELLLNGINQAYFYRIRLDVFQDIFIQEHQMTQMVKRTLYKLHKYPRVHQFNPVSLYD